MLQTASREVDVGEKPRKENSPSRIVYSWTPDRFLLVGGLTLSRPVKQLVRHQSLA